MRFRITFDTIVDKMGIFLIFLVNLLKLLIILKGEKKMTLKIKFYFKTTLRSFIENKNY